MSTYSRYQSALSGPNSYSLNSLATTFSVFVLVDIVILCVLSLRLSILPFIVRGARA